MSSLLPLYPTQDKIVTMLQTQWSALLNPLLAPPLPLILPSVALVAGSNNISHRLGRVLQGWYLTRLRASADIYDNQDNNPTPETTLLLISSVPVVVDLEVF